MYYCIINPGGMLYTVYSILIDQNVSTKNPFFAKKIKIIYGTLENDEKWRLILYEPQN